MNFIIYQNGSPIQIVTDESDVLLPGQTRTEATDEECEAARPIIAENNRIAERNAARLERFRNEADPLLAQYLAGEIEKETWLAKRAQIRAEIP